MLHYFGLFIGSLLYGSSPLQAAAATSTTRTRPATTVLHRRSPTEEEFKAYCTRVALTAYKKTLAAQGSSAPDTATLLANAQTKTFYEYFNTHIIHFAKLAPDVFVEIEGVDHNDHFGYSIKIAHLEALPAFRIPTLAEPIAKKEQPGTHRTQKIRPRDIILCTHFVKTKDSPLIYYYNLSRLRPIGYIGKHPTEECPFIYRSHIPTAAAPDYSYCAEAYNCSTDALRYFPQILGTEASFYSLSDLGKRQLATRGLDPQDYMRHFYTELASMNHNNPEKTERPMPELFGIRDVIDDSPSAPAKKLLVRWATAHPCDFKRSTDTPAEQKDTVPSATPARAAAAAPAALPATRKSFARVSSLAIIPEATTPKASPTAETGA